MKYEFTKMHGIGNDFVVFDTFSRPLSLGTDQIRNIADRHYGIGCDQVLLLEPPDYDGIDVRYRIFNADGTEVMQCGNGARCVAVYLKEKGLVIKKEPMVASTGAGLLELSMDNHHSVTINMGIPVFEPSRVPMQIDEYAEQYQVDLGGNKIAFSALSLGNPHAVIKVDDVDSATVEEIGAALQRHALFPEGVNVGFIEIMNRQAFKLRVYERGVGETLACGSGACAAMVIACQQGYLEGTIDGALRGGHLTLHWAGVGEPVYMSGAAIIVFEGEITL